MDIIFETDNGRSFTIEVGYTDTIAEIKEKVQKDQQIPVDHQSLYYWGELLCDDWDIQKSLLFHGACVQLLIADPNPPPVRNRIQIILRDETGKRFSIEIDVEDTVKSLKQTIAQIKGLTIDRIALRRESDNVVMQDSNRIRDYNLMDGSELIVSEKMGIFLVLPNGDKLEVNPEGTDKIQEMRKALEKQKEKKEVVLPEKYYFVLNRSVLDEKGSFQSNGVQEGDTIEIFIERVESRTAPSSSSSSSSANKIEIFLVLPNGMMLLFTGTRMVNVQEIRMHLEGDKRDGKVELPEEYYFFINNQTVTDEKQSLVGLGVREGDSVKILAGKAPSATSSSQAPPSSSKSSSSSKTMKIYLLLPNCNTLGYKAKRTTSVQGIRMHLEKERNNPNVGLPQEYYFFINNQTVMDEKQLIVGLGVQGGDSVKILAGKAPSATSSSQAPSSSSSSKTIMIFFELSNGSKLAFDANSKMNVQETKIHLEKAKKDTNFELPEPCFFVHNRSTMEDEQSLEWHGVREGDTIDVFAGRVVPLSMLKG